MPRRGRGQYAHSDDESDYHEQEWELMATPNNNRKPLSSTPTYTYSYMPADDGSGGSLGVRDSKVRMCLPTNATATNARNSDAGGRNSGTPRASDEVFVRGTLGGRDIEALELAPNERPERMRDYKGRQRMWPGVVLLALLLGAGGALMTIYAMKAHDRSVELGEKFEAAEFNSTVITGGKNNSAGGGGKDKGDIISDDGVVGNPKSYPPSACELPDYQSKDGHIVAVFKNGTEVPLKIKGINWFGMETGQAIPFGLWDNADNGTTAYQVASFLAQNKFNAVRLPLMTAWILENKVPNTDLINKQANRGVNVKNYLSLLRSIVKVLQYRNIGVMLSMHTLTFRDNGKLWYNADISEDKFLESIDILTETLCSNEYWNVMGIDLKNEPAAATWGDGGAADFREGAQRIANRMLAGCPQWLGFVEGVNGEHEMAIDGVTFSYYDWYGGGLQGARTAGVEFDIKSKVVWAPHYYTPAVYPQKYLFGGGTLSNGLQGYVELSDSELRGRVKATMDDMFGFLASETGPALLLGEFGGLYSKDLHPMKTTQRCTDYTIEVIKQPGWAGGFVWSLNPESEYQYNPADTPGRFFEGLVTLDWLSADVEYLQAMEAMDDMDNLQPFPCFPTKSTGKDTGSGSRDE